MFTQKLFNCTYKWRGIRQSQKQQHLFRGNITMYWFYAVLVSNTFYCIKLDRRLKCFLTKDISPFCITNYMINFMLHFNNMLILTLLNIM